jgi:endonuclease YncB( thermonuclease family)
MFSYFNIFKKKSLVSTDSLEYSKFNLENICGDFLVDSVYDGDTITIIVPTKLYIYNMVSLNTLDINSNNSNNPNKITLNKVKVRLLGIDTPELKPSKNLPNREEHILKAKEARDFLSNTILKKVIRVEFLHNDKYGRPLVKLFIKDEYNNLIYVNNLMVIKGFAKEYDGGTKDNDFTNFVDISF